MPTYEATATALRARAKIRALWASRHSEPNARAMVHYWVRVIRIVERS